jgi:hypothetical protein
MPLPLTHIRRLITEFKFKPLSVEELGWDNVRTVPLTVQAGDRLPSRCRRF